MIWLLLSPDSVATCTDYCEYSIKRRASFTSSSLIMFENLSLA